MIPDTHHSGQPPAQETTRSRASTRIAAAAAGFALSAGWYWFPRAHPLWTKTSPYLVSPYDAKGLALVLALFIGVKAAALLVFGPPLGRACAKAGERAAGSPLRQRLMLALPFLAVQVIAWLFLLPLLYPTDQPATPALLAPVLLGASDILFSLIWLSALIRLPGVACCFAYAASALGGLGLHWLVLLLSPAHAHLLRSLAPVLASPLIFLAMPPSECRADAPRPGERPGEPPGSRTSLGTPPAHVVFGFFAVMASLRALIDFSGNGFPFSQALDHAWPEPAGLDTLALLGHAGGGFFAAFAIRRRRCLRLPVLTLAFFGSCAVLLPLAGLARPASVAVFPLHLAAGTGTAFAIFLLGRFVRMGRPPVPTSCLALFALTVVVCLSGLSLWFIALRIHSYVLPPHEIYLQLLGLAVLLLIPLCYALRLPLRRALDSRRLRGETPLSPASPAARLPLLTRRELEVARLVQHGMKNLEISARLNIAETTLRVHLRSIYKKLGIRGRDNLAAVDLSELEEESPPSGRETMTPAAWDDSAKPAVRPGRRQGDILLPEKNAGTH